MCKHNTYVPNYKPISFPVFEVADSNFDPEGNERDGTDCSFAYSLEILKNGWSLSESVAGFDSPNHP